MSEPLHGSTIVLCDIHAEALEKVRRLGAAYAGDHDVPIRVEATTDRAEALRGADFVVISIEVGDRFKLWEQDWRIPQQFGIRQVYGENGGPGGLFHSLRVIPPILEICGDVQRLCPEAWVFNFSNPMSRICTTVKRRYPELRLAGLCHEIASQRRDLPEILGMPFERMEITAGGLNHFSFLLEARERESGRDLYPDLRARAPAYYADKPERGLFRLLLERYERLPITTDSHFGEYIHWAWEVADHKGILDFYESYRRYCAKRATEIGKPSGERLIPMIEAIVTDRPMRELAVNVTNESCIPELPRDLAVEVPVRVDGKGLHPERLPPVPKGIIGLWRNQVSVHDLTAEAVLRKSRSLALQALLADPVVHSFRAAEQTLEVMLEYQKDYLGYLR
jgi:alpha-galactosidase